MFYVEVHDESFQEWVNLIKNRYPIMLQAMKDVASIVQAETLPRTPLDTGRLGESFEYHVLQDTPKFITIQLRMSALNPNTGYDYAYIQHMTPDTVYHHPHGGAFFLRRGIQGSEDMAFEIIETDYYSLFG